MKHPVRLFQGRAFGILLILSTLLGAGCASQPVEAPPPAVVIVNAIEILDLIPWEDGALFEINPVPNNIIKLLYTYGYKYINLTQSMLEYGDTVFEGPLSIFTRIDAIYDDSDDTFVFQGKFYPDEEGAITYRDIWLLFSREENYRLFLDPKNIKTEKESLTILDDYSLTKRIID